MCRNLQYRCEYWYRSDAKKEKQMGETQENGWTTMNNDNEEKKDDLLYEKDEELSEWKMKKSVAT